MIFALSAAAVTLPSFVYDDAKNVPEKYTRSAYGSHESPVMSDVDDWIDGAQYKKNSTFCFNISKADVSKTLATARFSELTRPER